MISCGNIKMNSVDFIMIIDKDYNVIFNTRYESRVNNTYRNVPHGEYTSMNYFDAYPTIEIDKSSFVECLNTGKTVVRMYQTAVDYKGEAFCTHNITMPIIRKGAILGAIEIARDVTTVETLSSFEEEAHGMLNMLEDKEDEDQILTNNTIMLANVEKAKMFAKLPNPTLIYGETGTGKELFAKLIIKESGIDPKKVVTQNCAAVPENLIESILFGTVKGAYTGAENKKGLFEEADGGILFLDELATIPFHVQGKLLRVIQEGTFRPVGSNEERKVNVKIIAAMNVDPMEAIESKTLRSDLFYRFSSGIIDLLPLRERTEDIEYYLNYFLKKFSNIYGKKIIGADKELIDIMNKYRWDGNVREFTHLIESMVCIAHTEYLGVKDLPNYIYKRINNPDIEHGVEKMVNPYRNNKKDEVEDFNLRRALKNKEKNIIIKALEKVKGNKSHASELLGIPRQTLNYKIDKLDININDFNK